MQTLATGEVQQDSTFKLEFDLVETEKIKISFADDFIYLFVEPGKSYNLAVADKNVRNFNNPFGNQLQSRIIDLPQEDLNYKILAFEAWYNQFMGDNYHFRTQRDSSFYKSLVAFQTKVRDYYITDSNEFLRTFVKYRIASIEDLNYIGARSERERYIVNLAPVSVFYQYEEYMMYIRNFYKNYFESLSDELNEKAYKAILAGSPTRLINILSGDYRVANVRLRELVMIIGLSDVYHDRSYPQSRVRVVLDSISRFARFQENKVIAQNTLKRLKQLNPGSKAPNFEFRDSLGQVKRIEDFQGKYLYIQFANPNETKSILEFGLMRNLFEQYNSSISFLTIVNTQDWTFVKQLSKGDILWPILQAPDLQELKETFQLAVFPSYLLIDPQGYLVQSPAASPSPDGTYKTIDFYFFQIHKAMMQRN
jgi:hypothetical protein